ncbi:MAG TPA: hypothetical protein VF466_03375 [Candidatus Saccharimonadales bacterium]
MAEIPLAASIIETLAVRDPRGTVIVVGGAALHLQMTAAGLEGMPTGDVDGLCSEAFFDDLLVIGPHVPDVCEFRFTRPAGALRDLGATHPGIFIRPDPDDAPNLLPFSVTTVKGSPSLVEYSYDDLARQPDKLVRVGGITCLSASDVLHWKAILGRAKDLRTAHKALPKLHAAGLVTDEQRDTIRREVAESWAQKHAHKGRYYARVDTRP